MNINKEMFRMQELSQCASGINPERYALMSYLLEQAKDNQNDEKEFSRMYEAFMSVARVTLTTEDSPAMIRTWSKFYPDKPWEVEE